MTSIQQGTSGPLALAGPAVAGGLSPIPGLTISAASIRQASKAAAHPPSGLVRYLEVRRAGAQYLVAVSGSLTAAPYIISTGQPVMALGGYTGMDPWSSLSAFKTMVAQGIHYVLVGSGLSSLGFGGRSLFGGGHISPAFLHQISDFIAELKKHPRTGHGAFPGLFGDNNSGPSAVDQWARTYGVAIPPGAYGVIPGDALYYVSPLSTRP